MTSAKKTGALFVVEDCVRQGSLAQEIFTGIASDGLQIACAARSLGDGFVTHGCREELLHECGLDGKSLADWIAEETQHG